MPWLTQFINQRVTDHEGRELGRVEDLLAGPGRYPSVTRFAVALNRSGRELMESESALAYLELDQVTRSNGKLVYGAKASLEEDAPDSDVGLRAALLDRQIIDTEGARIVRVNDVWLAEGASGLRVVGADVGLGGILRRLGLEEAVRKILSALGYQVPEKLIPWSYIAPLEQTPGIVQLTVAGHRLRNLHPGELADILDRLEPDKRDQILVLLSDERLADILADTDPSVSRAAVEALGTSRTRRILEIMPPDEAADLLGDIGYDRSERLLSMLGLGQAAVLRELLGYPPETAGGRMTPSYVAVSRTSSADEAIEVIRREASKAETVYYAYVLDHAGRLNGLLSLRDLLRSHRSKLVEDLMDRNPVSVHVMDDQEDVAHKMARYDLLALPVVDDRGVLKGIVTVDDIVEVLEAEASEDLAEVAGVYLGEGPGARAGRLAGFGMSIVGGVAAAALLDSRRAVLAGVAAVAWLVPVYLRVSQDLGTWSLARALVSSSADYRSRLESLAQELVAALLSATAVGVFVGAFGAWWSSDALVGTLLGVGIFVGALGASVIGLALPTLARSMRLEWLLARGRLLAMIVGLASVVVYVWSLGPLGARLS